MQLPLFFICLEIFAGTRKKIARIKFMNILCSLVISLRYSIPAGLQGVFSACFYRETRCGEDFLSQSALSQSSRRAQRNVLCIDAMQRISATSSRAERLCEKGI